MSKLIAPARSLNLRAAIRRAREGSAYWRSILSDVPGDEIGPDFLQSLPILTSTGLAQLGDATRIRAGVPDMVRFTGGSTGKRIPIARSLRGPTIPHPAQIGDADPPPRPLGLGTSLGSGEPQGHNGVLLAPLRHRQGYDYAVEMLLREHAYAGYTPRIQFVALPLPVLKRLIYVLIESGCDPKDLEVTLIWIWGYHLSPGWRRQIQQTFPEAVFNTCYGFTETKATAFGCRGCGAYHYGPDVVWEVLDLGSATPGLGRLVVTPLCDRDTVLFRYAPGDVVLETPVCPLVGETGFRFAGRRAQMLPVEVDGEHRYPVWPVHVQDAVDTTHWIGRYNAPRHGHMTVTEGDGHPKWRIVSTRGGRGLSVELELTYDPRLFRDAWRQHQAQFLDALCAASPHPDLIRGPSPAVDLVGLPPGGLPPDEIFRC